RPPRSVDNANDAKGVRIPAQGQQPPRLVSGGDKPADAGKDRTLSAKRRTGKRGEMAMLGVEVALAVLIVSGSIATDRSVKAKLNKAGTEFARASAEEPEDIAELDNDDDTKKEVKYADLVRPTWLVRPNEDLCKLAEHLFHEADLGWLIADLNARNIKET